MLSSVSETTAAPAPAKPEPRWPTAPRFPNVVSVNGRGYMLRSQLNDYKSALQAASLGLPAPPATPAPQPDPFVPLKQVALELGVGRRTIGRRIVESRASEAK